MCKILMILTSPLLILFGAEWQSLNGPPVGRVDDINIGWDPIHSYYAIYAADQTHKLYKSINEGEYWDSIPTIPPNPNIINPTCVITAPSNAQVVYIGKNGTTPVWWSQDGGVNWGERSGIPPNNYITNPNPSCFGIDPLSAQRIYLGCAAQLSEYSLFFSSDGGANWYGRGNQGCDVNCILVVHEPASAESLFMATSQGIYFSTNGGSTWILCQGGNFLSICDFVANNIRIFYAVQGTSGSGIYRSVDGGGAVWSSLGNSPPYPIRITAQRTTPSYVYCGTQFDYVYRSTNNGSSWEQINYHFCDTHIRCILTHPSDHNTIFAGTDECFYKSTDGGDTWQEKTSGRKVTQFSHDLSLALPDAVFVSYHGTSTWKLENNIWTLRFTYPPATATPLQRGAANGDVLIDDNDHSRVYATSEVRHGIDTDYICRSTNGGWTWENVTPQNLLLNRKSLALDPGSDDTVYIVGESPPQFLKSKDYGVTWELHTINYNPPDVTPPFYSIDISSTGPKTIYLGDISFGVSKSTDGGQTWNPYISGLPLSRIDAFAVDPDKPEIIYSGTLDGIYKSIDNGVTWSDLGLAASVKDIEIDYSEPTIFYAILEGVTQDEIVCTVDRGRQTFTVTENLPDACNDVEIDRHYSDAVYIATEKGIYNYTPDFNKHLVSSSNMATSYNNGKKMIAGLAEIWVTYESGGVIYAVHSSDGGGTWSKKMEIGYGYNPVIASKPEVDPPVPCVVWRAQNTRDTLYFARYVSDDDWTTPLQIVNTDNDYGPPSFVIGADNIGRIAYDMNGKSYYTEFDIDNPAPITPEDIGRGINPSVGYMMPGANNPEIHVAWEDNLKIKYRSRTVGGSWGSEETVFSSNSHRPSIEIAGSNVYVVWERSGVIYYRYAVYIQNGNHSWTRYVTFSNQYSLNYPVLTGGSAMSCVANVNGKGEIYFWYDPGTGWIGPINISNTPNTHSEYTHIVHRQTIAGTVAHFIWTENDNPVYDIRFANYSIGGYDSNKDLAFYVAQGGDTLASPFNLKRTGFLQYGSEPFKHVDYDNQYLEYEFRRLDPSKDYALTAYAYQEGYAHLPLTIKIDNVLIGGITLPSETLITFKKLVPCNFYADSVINIKIFGNKAVGSSFVLHQYEREPGGSGGPQSLNAAPVIASQPTMTVYPTAVKDNFTIEFSSVEKSQIAIGLYDITGRLIKVLLKSDIAAGKHRYDFSASDLPQGIYFIHVDNIVFHLIGKIILIK